MEAVALNYSRKNEIFNHYTLVKVVQIDFCVFFGIKKNN